MIDSTAFGRIRRRLMKALAPEFSERKGIYTRHTKSQLHCIQFASGKWGKEFSVDIGIHFERLPSFEAFGHVPKRVHPEPNTCCFERRWRDGTQQQLFPYGDTNDEAERFLSAVIADCLKNLDDFNTTWGDGTVLLEKLPPQTLASDAILFKRLLDCPDNDERDRLSSSMQIRIQFPGWFPHVSPMCVMLAYFAKEAGDLRRVSEYLSITTAPGQGHIMLPMDHPLIAALQ